MKDGSMKDKYYPHPIAPVNYDPREKPRSRFSVHVFVTAPTPSGPRILDATSGPYIGLETLQSYLDKAIDRSKSRHIYEVFQL
jgi:hypothetical protein